MLTIERKNRDPFVFRPFAKLIVSCNNLPQTGDRSRGYFRRWIILPFTETFTGAKRDPLLAQKIIETELSGVLNWAIGGFKALRNAGGFIEPDASREALAEYRRDSDSTIAFAEDCIRQLPDTTGTSLSEVFDAYKKWMREANLEALGRTNFRKAIERTLGIQCRRGEGGRYLPGVALTP